MTSDLVRQTEPEILCLVLTGTMWSEELMTCDYSDHVNCGDRPYPDGSTSPHPSTTTEQITTTEEEETTITEKTTPTTTEEVTTSSPTEPQP